MTICGCKPALIAQSLHFGCGKRLEVHRDTKILIENLHAVDAADGGRNRQAHSITQALIGCDGAKFHQFATAAKTLHPQPSDTSTVGFWQDLSFEAAESRIAAIERHLNGVEGKIVRQHL